MEGVLSEEKKVVDLTFLRLMKIWWALSWRGLLIIVGGSFTLGIIIGVLAAIMGVPTERVMTLSRITGGIWGLLGGIVALWWGLQVKFKDFEIQLVQRKQPIPAPANEPT